MISVICLTLSVALAALFFLLETAVVVWPLALMFLLLFLCRFDVWVSKINSGEDWASVHPIPELDLGGLKNVEPWVSGRKIIILNFYLST